MAVQSVMSPTGNAWVVFDDNNVRAACWNGVEGGMAVLP